MRDPRLDKLADVLVNYSVGVQPGDRVMIQGSTATEPLLKAVLVKVLQAGGHPFSQVSLPGTSELVFRHASDEQLQYIPEPMKLVMETLSAFCRLLAVSSRSLASRSNSTAWPPRCGRWIRCGTCSSPRSSGGSCNC